MKVTVENPIKILKGFAWENIYNSTLLEFNLLLTRICNSENGEQLRSSTTLDNYEHFLFGFGGSHMWVKQIVDGEPKQQVIFVQF